MVFPLYDDNTDRHTTPFVNYAIIAAQHFCLCCSATAWNRHRFHLFIFDCSGRDYLWQRYSYESGTCDRLRGPARVESRA